MVASIKIQGEFITRLAREKCFYEGDFNYAIELLMNSMVSEVYSKNEILNMAITILDGRAELKGTYPNSDYGFVYLDEKNDKWDLGKLIEQLYTKVKNQEKERDDILQKYLFVLENMGDMEMRSLSRNYKREYGDELFEEHDCDEEI